MVGWLRWTDERGFGPRVTGETLLGLPLAALDLPVGQAPSERKRRRRLRQGMAVLTDLGIVRLLTEPRLPDWPTLREHGFQPVDPVPLCRAFAPELAMAALESPPSARSVALRGERAERWVWAAADALCPAVGTVELDFDVGEEELSRHLWERFGAATFHVGAGPAPDVTLEFAKRDRLRGGGRRLRLWGGEPDLGGLALRLREGELPAGADPLCLLALLWETGRVERGDVRVTKDKGRETREKRIEKRE